MPTDVAEGDNTRQTLPRLGRNLKKVATDYDAPRKTDEELAEESLEELKARRNDELTATVDVDEADLAESIELPGADLSSEQLSVHVLPTQTDEFTCVKCFLVKHRTQLSRKTSAGFVCLDCD